MSLNEFHKKHQKQELPPSRLCLFHAMRPYEAASREVAPLNFSLSFLAVQWPGMNVKGAFSLEIGELCDLVKNCVFWRDG